MKEIPNYKELIVINKNLLRQIRELLKEWEGNRKCLTTE